jgi:hypothetical protein
VQKLLDDRVVREHKIVRQMCEDFENRRVIVEAKPGTCGQRR